MLLTGVHKIGGGLAGERLPRKSPTKRHTGVVVSSSCFPVVFVIALVDVRTYVECPPALCDPRPFSELSSLYTFFADPLRVTLPFRPACQWLGVPVPNDLGCSFDWHNLLFEGCFLIGTRPVSTRQGFIDGGRR